MNEKKLISIKDIDNNYNIFLSNIENGFYDNENENEKMRDQEKKDCRYKCFLWIVCPIYIFIIIFINIYILIN